MEGHESSKGRNWPEYNEDLVKRGEIYLTFDFLESWERDLEELNRGKRGRKFAYPWSFIELLDSCYLPPTLSAARGLLEKTLGADT